jgi:glutathione synthase/RimK-type ligase-like ATP-grasp enzyme
MSIGIVSCHNDAHAFAVKRELERSFRASCHVFDCDRSGLDGREMSWLLAEAAAPLLMSSEKTRVGIRALDLIWFRRAAFGEEVAAAADSAYAKFVKENYRAAGLGILLSEFNGIWIDHPLKSINSENKIIQAYVAREAGIRIPRTLVSQSPDAVREFCDTLNGEVIVKPIQQVADAGARTKKVGDELLTNDQSIGMCPVMYQELIPGRRHIRAHIFGDHVLAAILESDDLDWRWNLNIPCRQVTLPDELQKKMYAALDLLGLSMGVFDLKLTDEGEYVWLEVNPQGQFLFIEGMCGLPLTRAMADFLHTRSVGR